MRIVRRMTKEKGRERRFFFIHSFNSVNVNITITIVIDDRSIDRLSICACACVYEKISPKLVHLPI